MLHDAPLVRQLISLVGRQRIPVVIPSCVVSYSARSISTLPFSSPAKSAFVDRRRPQYPQFSTTSINNLAKVAAFALPKQSKTRKRRKVRRVKARFPRKSKKFRRREAILRSQYLKNMAEQLPEIEKTLAPLRASVKEQGDLVRQLKESGAPKIDLDKAVIELKARKRILEEKEIALCPKEDIIDRLKLEELLRRRFFYVQSFEIYGGITGLYDYGPMGCAMKTNLLNVWRNHFVLEESMLEVDCAMLTPEPVLKASGHVERFSDFMVKDVVNGECFRADHLIKGYIEKTIGEKTTTKEMKDEFETILARLDGFSCDDMAATIKKFNMKSPHTNNDLTEPMAFNLMFPTSIGPTGQVKGYLRPETAQGIFVNFKRLLEFNQGRLPFAAAQIGAGFRNEISPRQGLIRVREFTMAEIEHFVDPKDKSHPKFDRVRDYKCVLFSACNQMDGKPAETHTIGDAVGTGLIANETLGYFIARVHQFMVKVGVDPRKLRFRQHMNNEMAHYACDCWDAECLTTYGWIECVGNADRSCYDLNAHADATGVRLAAEKPLPEPKIVDVLECQPNKQKLGQKYKQDSKALLAYLNDLNDKQCADMQHKLDNRNDGKYIVKVDGKEFELSSDMVEIKRVQKKLHVDEFVPSVIEPSFGVGRILYSVFEHNFRVREDDEMRQFLAMPPLVAPIKCSVLPLSGHDKLRPLVQIVCNELLEHDVMHRVDQSSGSIGRRYARTDEIGIPFGVTIDFESIEEPHSVTVRELVTMQQIRVPVSDLGSLIRSMCTARSTWTDALNKYPIFEA